MSLIPGPGVGLSLKPQHYAEAKATTASGLWFEVHPENYLCEGGPRLAWLEAVRSRHPLSLHGVGLSLAADEEVCSEHLSSLRKLIDRFEPFVFSEHLAWSQHRGVYHPDLLPFPRSRSALDRVAQNVSRTQEVLGRRILIENPSLYLPLKGQEMSEVEFLTALVKRTGCGLLVDVNNVQVSATNLGYSAAAYLDAIPAQAVEEIHLAGHTPDPDPESRLLIDSHGEAVADVVWALYERLIRRIGPRPTLIERDDNIPQFDVLMVERERACEVYDGGTFPEQRHA